MPESEFRAIMEAMNEGFTGVHGRIDSFKDEFHGHQLACRKLFEDLHMSEAQRKGAESQIATSLKDRINWGVVKTGLLVAVLVPILAAAIKILMANIDKFKW